MSHLRTVNLELIEELKQKALASERGRAHYTFHEPQEYLQRMVNVLTELTYVAPHKHANPDKAEHFVVIEGKVACISHDDEGNIQEVVMIGPDEETVSVDIRPNTYHTFVCFSKTAVMLEFVEGPYDAATHKKFAPFAPGEENPNKHDYVTKLKEAVLNTK
jgi:cupin fold WbuC family metalloprotein